MDPRPLAVLFLVLWLCICSNADSSQDMQDVLSRYSFPKGFVFGAASASYQVEGATKEDGRKPSNWDVYSQIPGKIADGSTADPAIDQYHRYKEDFSILDGLGADAYRLSIDWPRMLPDGTGSVNPKAISHYNDVIDTLLAKGLKPYVTLFHWDIPYALEKSYGGFLSSKIVDDFGVFVEACFKAFGDRVKNWITLNEPHIFAVIGYNIGVFAPGRCSPEIGNCTGGDSSMEPYVVGHHLLLAHAKAIEIYTKRYKASQKGTIGLTLDTLWYEPVSNSKQDKAAAERARQFNLGWMLHPVTYGEYPPALVANVGSRLPKFTAEEKKWLQGTSDFIGINHYFSLYVKDNPNRTFVQGNLLNQRQAIYHPAYYKDVDFAFLDKKKGVLIGRNINGFYVVPYGIRRLMNYIKDKYRNPIIYITENGISDTTNSSSPLAQQLDDQPRINYYKTYLSNLAASIRDGCRVQAYFLWSFLDSWEWGSGYNVRFGIIHVELDNSLKRIPKKSAKWYAKFLKKKH
ncbi:beta-glucosidase 6 [Selaginella moellendorffii]|uniref:beta-glucosidase 6 n=1 Tax=Selaginella moellendorffii TaxID=88036 RepID=UPI000D1C7978|nr:beta-glucosidase 6 [Selaginella moellendorffii]|eukprot:XP_024528298.1 beta-glucosidase 6 [Selaginella moellendorffii]